MKILIILIIPILIFSLYGCETKKAETQLIEETSIQTTTISYTYEIYQNPDNSFGYDIYSSEKGKIIHQPNIPGVAGNAGFQSENAAKQVAQLMVNKLEKNIFPPTVSQEELDSLK